MLKNSILFVAIIFFIAGCGAKKPKSLDSSSQLRPNVSVLEQRYNFVPKDAYLSSFNWTYQINAKKEGGYLLQNEQMVKTFLLAHNASKIIIVGKKELIREYYRYFKENQVETPIVLQDIEPIDEDLNSVNIMFFNQTRPSKKVVKSKIQTRQPTQLPCRQNPILVDCNNSEISKKSHQDFNCLFDNEKGGNIQ